MTKQRGPFARLRPAILGCCLAVALGASGLPLACSDDTVVDPPTAQESDRPGSPNPGDPTPDAPPTTAPTSWLPAPGSTWQWQLDTGQIDESVDADIYDIDGFDADAGTVQRLHESGRHVICYLSLGAWEDWRPDAGQFPAAVLGTSNGWEGERWLDVRQVEQLRPIIASRLDMCAAKGFDAVEADNVDGYVNDTGFAISRAEQVAFLREITAMAHERGMAIGLKNSPDLVPDLVDEMDFAVVEECYRYGECESYVPFIEAGKAVLHVEYDVPAERFCPQTTELGFSSMAKRMELDAWRDACP